MCRSVENSIRKLSNERKDDKKKKGDKTSTRSILVWFGKYWTVMTSKWWPVSSQCVCMSSTKLSWQINANLKQSMVQKKTNQILCGDRKFNVRASNYSPFFFQVLFVFCDIIKYLLQFVQKCNKWKQLFFSPWHLFLYYLVLLSYFYLLLRRFFSLILVILCKFFFFQFVHFIRSIYTFFFCTFDIAVVFKRKKNI